MSTAKTGLNWSRTVERYVPRSLPLYPMLVTVMSTARDKSRGDPHLEPRYYLDYLPYNFQKVKKNMASSKYVRQTEEKMERLLIEKDSKNTKRAISTSVKCFRNYLQANGIDQEFESFETGVLNSRLKEYYASVRKA